jgi:colanic acid biosynthesis glycosyl transferase WcaI
MLASGRHVLVTADPGTELYNFLRGTAVIVPAGDARCMAEEIFAIAHNRPSAPAAKYMQLAAAFDSKHNLAAYASILSGLAGEGVASRESASFAPGAIDAE